jgi:hypothetical protein
MRRVRNTLWYTTPLGPNDYRHFRSDAKAILRRRTQQTLEQVSMLGERYSDPIFGEVRVWDLLLRMQQVSDPTDTRFGNVSQLTHTLQVLESMENAGITDEDMHLAALLHDLGKLLALTGEAPENIFGMKSPIGPSQPGIGLDRVRFQWNHDDFIYQRFKGLVSEPTAWLLRFHSIIIPECERYMDQRDREYTKKYLLEFQIHDQESKSMFRLPKYQPEDYRDWIFAWFPEPVLF